MKAVDLLNHAAGLVGGERDRTHGTKYDNFRRIAAMWNAYLGVRANPAAQLTAEDVGLMMVALKLARTQHGSWNPDDYVDMAGYAACASECALTDRGIDPVTGLAPLTPFGESQLGIVPSASTASAAFPCAVDIDDPPEPELGGYGG